MLTRVKATYSTAWFAA